ncbi:hypothetical protein DH2020_013486 [Rehmannia glutinosa]|uniref:Endonuclease/exonuclease/phosphatase domain-containing protein n=1 Tax=Rehmannia glutinosa TaxID=99300 RepID=A0ABR0X2F7_REHGL
MLIRNESPDIVFLMETKLYGSNASSLRVKLGYHNGVVVDSVGRSGGLALLWREEVNVSVKFMGRFFIDSIISNAGSDWRFTGFYGNPDRSQRIHSWSLIRRLSELYQLPWIVGGDFNDILHPSKKYGGAAVFYSGINSFEMLWTIVGCETWDLWDRNLRGEKVWVLLIIYMRDWT